MPKIRDGFGFNAKFVEFRLASARERSTYLIARRDALAQTMRIGALTLNLGSLAAILSALGSDKFDAARFLKPLEGILALLILGGASAAISCFFAHIRFVNDASAATTHLRSQETLAARLETEATPTSVAEFGAALDEDDRKGSTADFSYSKAETFFTNVAGSMWIAAILTPAFNLLKAVDWSLPF